MRPETLEYLMNHGFRKAYVENRHALIREFELDNTPMIEIYESSNDGIWEQQYYGHKHYIEKYIKREL